MSQLTGSLSAFKKAKKYLVGGVNSPARAFNNLLTPPLFIKSAKGSHLFDIDGNKYIDFCLSWGSAILGHANKDVVSATIKALKNGSSFGASIEGEAELARLITSTIPSIELIRFTNSGTEATASAIRLARFHTNKELVLKFDGAYHGALDYNDRFISLPYNDQLSVEKAFQEFKGKIAAIIVEPVCGNMGVVLPQNNFLKFLREISTKNKTLLIFDEVITGYRNSLGGAQGYYKIKPDLITLGKIIGGGLPVGAFGGGQEIMSEVAPMGALYQAGTFSGNPVTVAAGIVTLRKLKRLNFYKNIIAKADNFTSKLSNMVQNYGWTVNSFGTMFTLFAIDKKVNNFQSAKKSDIKKFAKLHKHLIENGVYFSPSQLEANFISSSHTEKELKMTLKKIEEFLAQKNVHVI